MFHASTSLNVIDEHEYVVSMALNTNGHLAVLSTKARIQLCKFLALPTQYCEYAIYRLVSKYQINAHSDN